MITSEFPPKSAGTGNYVHNISRKLVEKGHKVSLITRGSANRARREAVDGIKVFRVPFIPIYPFHVSLHGMLVNRLVKSLEPGLTLIHSHIPFPPLVRTSLPTVTTVHDNMKIELDEHERWSPYSVAERLHSIIEYRLEVEVLKSSDRITAVSKSAARELKKYGLDPEEIVVIGNGVDERIFCPNQNKMCAKRYVLYAGRLSSGKGLFDLMKCAKLVCDVHRDVEFVIAGNGPLLGKLVEEARRMGLQGRVTFLGEAKRDELIRLYQNATIHVIPSHYEAMPTVLLEAMSCGLPVVATAVGGSSEVVSSGVNGLLVPSKTPEEMARAISQLLEDDVLRKKIGRAARETIEGFYTLDKISEKVLDCYRSVI